MRRFALIVLVVISGSAPLVVQAARFSESADAADADGVGYYLSIDGQISRGDYKQLIAFIKKKQKFPTSVSIESPGGDVNEAMSMGRLFRKALVNVNPSGQCNSSCALIVFASAGKLYSPSERIGIHRPIYDSTYFSGLSFSDAQEKTRQIDREVRAYLKEMDVPTDIADKMMSVSSSSVIYLTMQNYHDQAGQPAAVSEWLNARCPMAPLEPGEAEDFANAMAYFDYMTLMELSKDVQGLERTLAQAREEAKLGAQLPTGYRNYLLKKFQKQYSCEKKSIDEQQRRALQTMK
jgi:hypothetical protein